MGLKLKCSDLGNNCPFVAHGETMEELTEEVWKHAKEVHGYTDEQILDPKMMETVKAAIQKE